MKKNLYYHDQMELQNPYAGVVRGLFVMFLSFPKFVLDVFLRKNMGERYFTFFKVIIAGIFLFFSPRILAMYKPSLHPTTVYHAFMIAYGVMCLVRYREVRREPSVFDFAKYSKSTGLPNGIFRIKFFTRTGASLRTIEIYNEPIVCILIGIILFYIGQDLTATIIILCAIAYGVTNHVMAVAGDNFIMDKIDEIICNEDLAKTFVQGKELSDRQFPFYAKKPATENLRQKLVDNLLENDDDDDGTPVS